MKNIFLPLFCLVVTCLFTLNRCTLGEGPMDYCADWYTTYEDNKASGQDDIYIMCQCELEFTNSDLRTGDDATYFSVIKELDTDCVPLNGFPSMPNLKELRYKASSITPSIGNAPNLEELLIESRGNYPNELYNCTQLQKLRIDGCVNEFPAGFDNYTNLYDLLIEENSCLTSLNTVFPNSLVRLEVTNCTNLANVDFLDYSFPVIEYLELSYSNISELPSSMGNHTNLIELDLSDLPINTLPDEIGNLNKLRILDLDYSNITTLPNTMSNMISLESFSLYENNLTKIDDWIGGMTNLIDLIANSNKITNISNEIGKLRDIEDLFLGDNQLTNLPDSIINCKNLKALHLFRNPLQSFPPEISELINLEVLSLSETSLDEVDESIGNLTKLNTLWLRNNNLTNLPSSIANLKNTLKTLGLQGNNFSDEAKADIANWLPNTTITY